MARNALWPNYQQYGHYDRERSGLPTIQPLIAQLISSMSWIYAILGKLTRFANAFLSMDAATFRNLVLSDFPSLRQDFEEWEDLIHLQVSEFLRFTQGAIEARSFEVVTKCFELAAAALVEGDDSLRNAIYVSYLEDLDLRSDAGKRAAQLMPVELKQGREDILDYDRELLGRKRPVDDR